VPGIDIVGPLPAPLQTLTYFAAGIAVPAKNPQAARKLIDRLTSGETRAAMLEGGMQPAAD
jgi:molybdate transport system substrate-binding protein